MSVGINQLAFFVPVFCCNFFGGFFNHLFRSVVVPVALGVCVSVFCCFGIAPQDAKKIAKEANTPINNLFTFISIYFLEIKNLILFQ